MVGRGTGVSSHSLSSQKNLVSLSHVESLILTIPKFPVRNMILINLARKEKKKVKHTTTITQYGYGQISVLNS